MSQFGRVQRREYQLYLLNTRDEEYRQRLLGKHVRPKPLEKIRAEFEEKFGSRFLC